MVEIQPIVSEEKFFAMTIARWPLASGVKNERVGKKKIATDPIWSVDMNNIDYHIVTQGIIVYYLKPPAPKRGFVKEEILILPYDTHVDKL